MKEGIVSDVAVSHIQLCDPMAYIVHGILQAGILKWVSLSLLQGIFPPQGLNPALPQCRQIFYQVSHKGRPRMLEWVAYPFSSRSSQPRNQTRVSCIHCIFINNLKLPGALVKVSIYHASIIILWHVGCIFIKVIYTYTFYSA